MELRAAQRFATTVARHSHPDVVHVMLGSEVGDDSVRAELRARADVDRRTTWGALAAAAPSRLLVELSDDDVSRATAVEVLSAAGDRAIRSAVNATNLGWVSSAVWLAVTDVATSDIARLVLSRPGSHVDEDAVFTAAAAAITEPSAAPPGSHQIGRLAQYHPGDEGLRCCDQVFAGDHGGAARISAARIDRWVAERLPVLVDSEPDVLAAIAEHLDDVAAAPVAAALVAHHEELRRRCDDTGVLAEFAAVFGLDHNLRVRFAAELFADAASADPAARRRCVEQLSAQPYAVDDTAWGIVGWATATLIENPDVSCATIAELLEMRLRAHRNAVGAALTNRRLSGPDAGTVIAVLAAHRYPVDLIAELCATSDDVAAHIDVAVGASPTQVAPSVAAACARRGVWNVAAAAQLPVRCITNPREDEAAIVEAAAEYLAAAIGGDERRARLYRELAASSELRLGELAATITAAAPDLVAAPEPAGTMCPMR